METVKNKAIDIYTDGSCNPQLQIGAWASMIFINNEKIVIQGTANETTHNRMELMAVIEAIKFIQKKNLITSNIRIYTDSQYVERIPLRTERFISNNFKTKKGIPIQNEDLVIKLVDLLSSSDVKLIKVKAHQKTTEIPNYNREVDILARRLVRQELNKIST